MSYEQIKHSAEKIVEYYTGKEGIVDAAKEIHAGDYSISDSSNWEAAFIYERDNIAGEIRRIKKIENQM